MRRTMRRVKLNKKAMKEGVPAMLVQKPGRRAIRKGRKLMQDPAVRAKAVRAGILTASALGGPAGLAIGLAATSPKTIAKAKRLRDNRRRRRG